MKQADKIISSMRKSSANTTLSIGMARFQRKDKIVTNEINNSKNATSDAGSYTKNLIHTKSGSYASLSEIVNESRKFHEEMTSPTKIRGVRLISAKNYMDYMEGIRNRHETFDRLKNVFIEDYISYVDESEDRLGDMFNSNEYPVVSVLKERFYFESTLTPMPDTDNVEMFVSGEEIRLIKDQLEKDMLDTINEGQRSLWENMYETISKMADKCSRDIGSKGSVFCDKGGRGMVSDLIRLCTLIPKKDVLGDEELDLIRKDVEEKLIVNPDDLKKDQSKRSQVAENATQILDSMVGYMGYTPANKSSTPTIDKQQDAVERQTKKTDEAISPQDLDLKAERFSKYF